MKVENKEILIKIRAIILHEGKLMAVRHSAHADFVALPGGHLEWGEDIQECLSREIIEELGVRPDVGRLFYINIFTEKNKEYVEFFFEIKNGIDYLDIEKLTRSHAEEITEIVWVSPTDGICIMPKSLAEDFRLGKLVSNEVRYIKD